MKAVILMVATILILAMPGPVAAQSCDPPCFACPAPLCAGADWGVEALSAASHPVSPAGAASRHACWRMVEAQRLINSAAQALTDAESVRFHLDLEITTTTIGGRAWTSRSVLIGKYVAPDRLQGDLSVTRPWSELRSQVIVAAGQAFVSDPVTGEWREGLQMQTSYYPVAFAGCLLRMAEADMDGLVLSGWQMLEGVPVYYLKGMGGAQDEIEIEYWLGVEEGLPRRAIARTGERPGWSDEAHTVRLAATLTLPRDRSLTAK